MRRGPASLAFALTVLATALATLAIAGSRAPDPTATPTPPPPPATTAAPKAGAPAPTAAPKAEAAETPKAEAAETPTAEAASELPKCGDCHTDLVAALAKNPHARYSGKGKKPDPEDMCSTCHGDGTKHIESAGRRTLISTMKGATGSQDCLACHDEHQGLFDRRAGLLLEGNAGLVHPRRARQLGRRELPDVPLDARLRPEEHACSRRRPASSAPPATRRRPPRSRTSPTRTASTAAG